LSDLNRYSLFAIRRSRCPRFHVLSLEISPSRSPPEGKRPGFKRRMPPHLPVATTFARISIHSRRFISSERQSRSLRQSRHALFSSQPARARGPGWK